MFGFINANKPTGVSSRHVVSSLQRFFPGIKMGHAGTLDPLAGGVLVVGLGPATRLIPYVQASTKTYEGTFQLGVESDSLDTETELRELDEASIPSREQLISILQNKFTGDIVQTPPSYSAVKVNGKRAYKLARKGRDVKIDPRQITVYRIALADYDYPFFEITVSCSSGTYMRSLGRDIGNAVGSSAVMTALTRTTVGNFYLEDAIDCKSIGKAEVIPVIDPAVAIAHLPRIVLSPDEAVALQNGTILEYPQSRLAEIRSADDGPRAGASEFAAVSADGRLLAVMRRTNKTAKSQLPLSDIVCLKPAINFSGLT